MACTFRGNQFTEIEADDYERSCETNDDCMLAIDWNVCSWCPPCSTKAINVSDRDEYERDLRRAERRCLSLSRCLRGCARVVPRCIDGVCGTAEPVILDDPESLNRLCNVDEECVAVAPGDVCDPCACTTTAVNADISYTTFPLIDDLRNVECGTPSNASCAPCPEVVPYCSRDGVCWFSRTPSK